MALLALSGPFAGRAAAEPATILALGDSLTAGYGLRGDAGLVPQLQGWLTEQGDAVTIINAGVSGDTTAAALRRVDWALSPDIQAVIVTLGGNDILRGLPPAEARANLEAILQKIRSRDLPVLLIGLHASGNYGKEYQAAFDSIYPDLAAEYGTLLYPGFFDGLGSNDPAVMRQYLQADGIHPNAEGVRKIVQAIGPSVRNLIGRIKPGA